MIYTILQNGNSRVIGPYRSKVADDVVVYADLNVSRIIYSFLAFVGLLII